jgi:hypothetical protein
MSLSTTRIERVAYECETDSQAAESLGIEAVTLRAALEDDPALQAAWDRGRFLRRVKDVAGVTITVSQAGRELDMDGPAFRRLLDADPEVAAIWDQERRRLRRTAAEAVIKNAANGSRSAARYVEAFLRAEQTGPGATFDYQRVPINVMVEITGKSRQTLHNWTRDTGLPRNPDCTYNLADFFHWIQYRTSIKKSRDTADIVAQIGQVVRAELEVLTRKLDSNTQMANHEPLRQKGELANRQDHR